MEVVEVRHRQPKTATWRLIQPFPERRSSPGALPGAGEDAILAAAAGGERERRDEVRESGIPDRGDLGRDRSDAAVLHVRSDRRTRPAADHAPGVLLRFRRRGLAWQAAFFVIARDPLRL